MKAQIEARMWMDLKSMYANLGRWVEHIVHIDGVIGSSPVATTREPNRKVRLVLYIGFFRYEIEGSDSQHGEYV